MCLLKHTRVLFNSSVNERFEWSLADIFINSNLDANDAKNQADNILTASSGCLNSSFHGIIFDSGQPS